MKPIVLYNPIFDAVDCGYIVHYGRERKNIPHKHTQHIYHSYYETLINLFPSKIDGFVCRI